MMSPTLGVGLLTCLPTTRSACCGVTVEPAWLLPGLGSNWSAWLIVAVLVCSLGLATTAWSWSVAVASLASMPTVHTPVTLLYIPWLGTADTKLRPGGSRSVSWTLVAASGPLLPTVTRKVTVSPTLGRGSFTNLVTKRSACCGVTVELAWLLPPTGSNWSEWLMVAVLVCLLGLTTLAVSVNVAEAVLATAPTTHSPVLLV